MRPMLPTAPSVRNHQPNHQIQYSLKGKGGREEGCEDGGREAGLFLFFLLWQVHTKELLLYPYPRDAAQIPAG